MQVFMGVALGMNRILSQHSYSYDKNYFSMIYWLIIVYKHE